MKLNLEHTIETIHGSLLSHVNNLRELHKEEKVQEIAVIPWREKVVTYARAANASIENFFNSYHTLMGIAAVMDRFDAAEAICPTMPYNTIDRNKLQQAIQFHRTNLSRFVELSKEYQLILERYDLVAAAEAPLK